ncbi:hypothetical protein [Streptomyces mirabilis]|uniref:hypothetical protein n=1 Tax=Streptomyces mirabilis TaxID=68239 RepID=UPI0036AE4470
MSRTVAAAAVLATLALAGCSGSNTSSDKPPSAPSRTGSGFNAAGYLYGLDADKHSHRQIDAPLAKLEARCTDDVGVLTTAATNTATDVTDAKDTQSTYGVLATLAADLPSSGRVACQDRLSLVEKQLKGRHCPGAHWRQGPDRSPG